MSDQVVYLTAQNSRLTQQVEELKAKLAKSNTANNSGAGGSSIDTKHSTNNIESWTLGHLTYVLKKYGVGIDNCNLSIVVKKFVKLRENDSTDYYNNCKSIVKEWMNENEIRTIPGSTIIKISLIQTGFYLEKNKRIKELRKIATIARVSDDTLKSVNQTIERQKSVESAYNQVYDI